MDQKPKRQHWVPQFYLKYFATFDSAESSDPKIWMFSRRNEDKDAHRVGIKNVAVERHLYSPVLEGGSRNFAVEKQLAELEGWLSLRWEDIANRYIDLKHDTMLKKTLALFIAVQKMRTRVALEDTKKLHADLASFYDTLPKDENGNPKVDSLPEPHSKIDPTSWPSYKSATPDRLQQMFAEQIFDIGFSVVDDLLNKNWAIVATGEPVFITSDHPVMMRHPNRDKFGIRTKGTFITFPLSPKRMLLIDDSRERTRDRYWQLKPEGHLWLNCSTWLNCERFVYSPYDPVEMLAQSAETIEQKGADEMFEREAFPSRFKLGRNELCPCGSGLKWKKCHGKGSV